MRLKVPANCSQAECSDTGYHLPPTECKPVNFRLESERGAAGPRQVRAARFKFLKQITGLSTRKLAQRLYEVSSGSPPPKVGLDKALRPFQQSVERCGKGTKPQERFLGNLEVILREREWRDFKPNPHVEGGLQRHIPSMSLSEVLREMADPSRLNAEQWQSVVHFCGFNDPCLFEKIVDLSKKAILERDAVDLMPLHVARAVLVNELERRLNGVSGPVVSVDELLAVVDAWRRDVGTALQGWVAPPGPGCTPWATLERMSQPPGGAPE